MNEDKPTPRLSDPERDAREREIFASMEAAVSAMRADGEGRPLAPAAPSPSKPTSSASAPSAPAAPDAALRPTEPAPREPLAAPPVELLGAKRPAPQAAVPQAAIPQPSTAQAAAPQPSVANEPGRVAPPLRGTVIVG